MNQHLKASDNLVIWIPNNIQASYTVDLPLDVTEIFLSKGQVHLGRDLQQILRATDDRCYMMSTKHWAESAFSLPPRKKEHD